MAKSTYLICAGALILGLGGSAWATDAPAMHHSATAKSAKSPPTDEQLIASATKAAPAKVAENATIVVPEAKGGMRTVRKGTNGFTCMPDNPETPGPDPMCWDKNAGDWIEAYLQSQDAASGEDRLDVHAGRRHRREQH